MGMRRVEIEHEMGILKVGQQGWELMSVFDTNKAGGKTRDVFAVFKRPIA
jgi:hypothetical protein